MTRLSQSRFARWLLVVATSFYVPWLVSACGGDDGASANPTGTSSGGSGGDRGPTSTGNNETSTGPSTGTGATGGGAGNATSVGGAGGAGGAADSVAGAGGTLGTANGPAICEGVRDEQPDAGGELIRVEPGAPGSVIVNGNETTLREVVQSAPEGSVIELSVGTYELSEAADGAYTGVYITTANITLRGATEEASDVVIDSAYHEHGGETASITVDAPGVVLADFTVRRAIFHLIHLWENADGARIFNVNLVDGGQQFLKSSTTSDTVDDVDVACSAFVMTDAGRDNVWGYGSLDGSTTCYTGGIDTHNARSWRVRHNSFSGIYCDTDPGRPAHGKRGDLRDDQTYSGGLAEHAIHMWDAEPGSGHELLGNTIRDCGRGIGLGLSDPVHDSLVSNNSVFSSFAGSREHDVGISIERGVDIEVAHNTVYFGHDDSYPNAIEVRFDATQNVNVENNLTNREIRDRDGAVSTQSGNVSDATGALFVDPDAGDLHIVDCEAAPTTERIQRVVSDLDGEARPDETTVGADECAP
jgi:hypothetical protein